MNDNEWHFSILDTGASLGLPALLYLPSNSSLRKMMNLLHTNPCWCYFSYFEVVFTEPCPQPDTSHWFLTLFRLAGVENVQQHYWSPSSHFPVLSLWCLVTSAVSSTSNSKITKVTIHILFLIFFLKLNLESGRQ